MPDGFQPSPVGSLTDDNLAAGELRALRVEMRSWFELMLNRLDRYEGRIATLEQHRVDANERIDRHEQRLAALEAAVNNKT